MTTLHRAVVRAYTSATHKADVQLATSLPTLLSSVPVATDIPAAEVLAGRECAVLLFDDNPDNGVVVTVHGAVPSLATSIQDADGNTYVRTEETANEDKVRFAAGGTLRYVISNVSPHHDLTGDAQISGHAGVAGAPPDANKLLDVGGGATYTQKVGLHIGMGSQASPAAGAVIGVGGYALARTTGDTAAYGLDYIAGFFQITLAVAYGCRTAGFFSGSGYTLTDWYGFYAKPGSIQSATVTNWHGFYVPSMTIGTNRRAFWENGRSGTPTDADGNRFRSNTAFGTVATANLFGGGDGVVHIANAVTVPTANPTGGGILYVTAGALTYRGSAGTVTTIAPA